jgi:hypothetical protein
MYLIELVIGCRLEKMSRVEAAFCGRDIPQGDIGRMNIGGDFDAADHVWNRSHCVGAPRWLHRHQ